MRREPSLLRGAAAGAVGGLLGTGAKHLMEMVAPPRPPEREAPPAILIEKVEGHHVPDDVKNTGGEAISWVFGTLTGALYGVIAEYVPQVRAGSGVAFGAAFWAGAHEIVLPAAGLTPPVQKLGAYEQGNELVTHAIYGAIVEGGRLLTRNLLGATHNTIVIEDGELEVASV
jgi:putative membrane protein